MFDKFIDCFSAFTINITFIGDFKFATNSAIDCMPIIFFLFSSVYKIINFRNCAIINRNENPWFPYRTKFSPITARPTRPLSALLIFGLYLFFIFYSYYNFNYCIKFSTIASLLLATKKKLFFNLSCVCPQTESRIEI
jgi:hypothetical protein